MFVFVRVFVCANGLIKFGNWIVNQSLSLNSSICIFIAIKTKGDNFIHTTIIAPVDVVIQFKLSNDACYEQLKKKKKQIAFQWIDCFVICAM